jgi:hypothetical protein
MVAWARAAGDGETRGQNRGRGCLIVTGGARRGASNARGRRISTRGDFLRGRARFCGPAVDHQVLAGPLGQVASAALRCAGQLACQRWNRTMGGERRGKVMGLCREAKTAGAWVKKELKLILPKVKTKIFEYYFFNFSRYTFSLL